MTPDPAALLQSLGLGQYAAGVVTLLVCIAYLWSHVLAAFVPPPGPNASPGWKMLYSVLNAIAANWGNAANAPKAPAAP